ncbi:uncharacterized protein LOC111288358 [Durio zibethinus]|uniref:Uncharacterized protein LOC111288358 n=1 Tax=Durio zibethinus TaxID=66656 RepID=A0A6P5Y3G2_DURZI|nr:uncharacterized protein LOC111288358 [Durio zibethinus]
MYNIPNKEPFGHMLGLNLEVAAMKIENHHIMPKKKLEMFEILKEAILIPCKNINFIFFEVITSLPLFCFLVYYEILLQTTLLETSQILRTPPGYINYNWPIPFHYKKLNWEFSHRLIQLTLLYLLPLHVLELCSVLVTVDLASKIYAKEKSLTFKEMIQKPIQKTRLTGTFITSLYVLLLSTCTLLGLIWLVTNYYVDLGNFVFDVFFDIFYGAAFIVLLIKYLEWTAMWNMSIVISIMEGLYGHEALAFSAYFIRGSERRGLLLMLVFFVWGNGLRLPCLYAICFEGGNGIIAQISLFCVCNVIKWIACMVYFYDCKVRILEKKVDEERGGKDEQLTNKQCVKKT